MRGVAGWLAGTVLGVAALAATAARADTLWLTGSTGNSMIEVGAAHVLRIEGNQLVYTTGGNQGRRDITQIGRIDVDDDPVLSRAEQAMSEKRWDEATDGYVKTMRSPSAGWVKEWSALRLVQAAGQAGRFDAALDAYVELVKSHLDVAKKFRPALPESGKSSYLQEAEAEVKLALEDATLNNDQNGELMRYLFEIQKARGDATAAGETAEKLLKETGQAPASAAEMAASDLAAKRAVGEMKLAVADKAIEAKDYPTAIATIEADHGAFVDAKQQADALYIEARAREGLARTPDQIKDAAIAYMKVVADFKDSDGAPRVADSLAAAAGLMDKLGDPAAAARLRGKE